MNTILGVSAGFHDAAVSVIDHSGNILFAGHSERYSKIKNDPTIHADLLKEVDNYAPVDTVAFYERPWMHNIQQWYSGQREYGPWTPRGAVCRYLGDWCKGKSFNTKTFSHHLSHAAAGFQTSPFDEATVVVIDAIGELDTISIYHAKYDHNGQAQYKKLWGQRYPHSIGLFYTAITDRIGLKPMEDEYITMGMAGWGKDSSWDALRFRYVADGSNILFRENLHAGIDRSEFSGMKDVDLAASAQRLAEQLIRSVMIRARTLTQCPNLVYMGGVALNCVANSKLGDIFDDFWIMPNPGDAGSSLGAAALAYGRKLHWHDAFLGHNIAGPYPINSILSGLCHDKIVGVASGRAEFGPRALGNRSLLADPRGPEIKDKVNEIKKRQKFRPFAPIILEEYVDEYFEMPLNWKTSPYMQIVAKVRRPDLFPAITHVDGTARVQTVSSSNPLTGIRRVLEDWQLVTGCPMLLNTSLNIKGQPIVNDRADADRFQDKYGVKVFS